MAVCNRRLLAKRWFDVGPASPTLAQRQTNVSPPFCVLLISQQKQMGLFDRLVTGDAPNKTAGWSASNVSFVCGYWESKPLGPQGCNTTYPPPPPTRTDLLPARHVFYGNGTSHCSLMAHPLRMRGMWFLAPGTKGITDKGRQKSVRDLTYSRTRQSVMRARHSCCPDVLEAPMQVIILNLQFQNGKLDLLFVCLFVW